jgi:hypothetical protein
MHTVTQILPTEQHKNSKGEAFKLTLRKKHLSVAHNYWLYFVEAEHETWRKMGFAVFVTKQAFPNEQLADHLAKTLGIEEVKRLLEETTEEGCPLYFPQFHEGWAVH